MTQNQRDPARARFMLLMMMRLSAAALVVAGVVLGFSAISPLNPDDGRVVGIALISFGLIELAVVVPLMTRQWRTPPDA
ncbi:MAG: hypothetical protein ACKOUM_02410 [Sphingopyxis sp.]